MKEAWVENRGTALTPPQKLPAQAQHGILGLGCSAQSWGLQSQQLSSHMQAMPCNGCKMSNTSIAPREGAGGLQTSSNTIASAT